MLKLMLPALPGSQIVTEGVKTGIAHHTAPLTLVRPLTWN